MREKEITQFIPPDAASPTQITKQKINRNKYFYKGQQQQYG